MSLRLLLTVTATAAINLGLLLALIELSARAPTPPPVMVGELSAAPPPPPPTPPPVPAPPPMPPTTDSAEAAPPSAPLPPLALAPPRGRHPGLALPDVPVDTADLPALVFPARAPAPAVGAGVGGGGTGSAGAPDRRPVLVFAPDLEDFYPHVARQRQLEGRTRVRLALDAAGAVVGVQVVESDPIGIFEDAARAAARRLRYQPARRGGRAVPASIVVDLEWSLRSGM